MAEKKYKLSEVARRNKSVRNTNYNRNHTNMVGVRFSEIDNDLYEYIKSKPSMSGYIKDLIRKDMEIEKAALNLIEETKRKREKNDGA